MLSRKYISLKYLSRIPIHITNKSLFPPSYQYNNLRIPRLTFSTNLTSNYETRGSQNTLKTETIPAKNITTNRVKNAEEQLENLIKNLSTDIFQKNRVYKNDFIKVMEKIKELNFSTRKQGLLLLRCCADLLPDQSASCRMELAEQVWCIIKPHTSFDVEHYNELLRIYIANNRTLTVSSFINRMSPVKPNNKTYELFLKVLAEAGDLNQSTEVISNMKAQGLPATESIFNSLIVCESKAGNIKNINEVLTMMKSLKIERSADTYMSVARALAFHKKHDSMLDELEKAVKSGIQFEERHIMEIVKTLAIMGTYTPISQVLQYLPQKTLLSPSISPFMQSVTTQLVFQNLPLAALEIYKCLPLPSFGPNDDQALHGRSLVRDCVKASISSAILGLITQELQTSGRNPLALHNAAEAALKLGKVPLAQDLFTRMQQMNIPVRPHYFWPILLHMSKTYGEKGVINTLSLMMKMDVKPDYETIIDYTLPYVSFTSPQNLMKKFLDAGLNVTMVLTPMMETLLRTGQVRSASEICELFQGKIDAEKLMQPLVKGYLISSDLKSTVFILEDVAIKASEKNKDWTGRFLCTFMKHNKTRESLKDVMDLIKGIKSTKLKISTAATDYCMSLLPAKYTEAEVLAFKQLLIEITDERLVDDGEMFSYVLPHPKNMNEESLKAHLNELEAKNMNTRGVLRRLLQQYCREGNLKAAREIVDKCQKEGVFLSAGMKAAIFDLHVKLGELELAENSLADLNKTAPSFTLDEHKILDFATLMVFKKKVDRAMQMIREQSKRKHITGGRNVAMNCWRLLDVTASTFSSTETQQMFDLLTSLKYCQPTNAILGPLIRVHWKSEKVENLKSAVETFVRLSNVYKKTPLKHELLCKVLLAMGEGRNEERFLISEKTNGTLNQMAQAILDATRKVHGTGDVQMTLLAAFAELGFRKSVRKMLLDPSVKFHPDAILRRCERFADEKKTDPIELLAECSRGLRDLYVTELYDLILDVYQRVGNHGEALLLWHRMQEAEIVPSKKFITNICSLLEKNNKELPPELSLISKEQKKASSR